MERSIHKHRGKGCDCHPFGAHAHDPGSRWPSELLVEGRGNQREHDRGVQKQYLELKRTVEASGGRILKVESELELKRKVAKARQEFYERTGERPNREHLEMIAREFGCAVGSDGRVKIPDSRVIYSTASGEVKAENQDFSSGRGRRMKHKVEQGFVIGGIGRGRKAGGLRIPDSKPRGRRALPDLPRDL